ncbi:hypothetical protein IMSAG249_02091 [Lachnospiraceae bacterium]|nr:hypothetical protein IMSAG249_02091 [Lachnospiraceae bacterium]
MTDMTYELLEAEGIDTSMIKVCKKIRNLAKLNRIVLDNSTHRSGLNQHLFDYIEYCGLDTLTFIKSYLSNLQPYMIERRKDQEAHKSFVCVIDNLYKISVYIKIDTKQFEEIIISFHEDNKRGIAKSNKLQLYTGNKYVPIFADSVLSKVENENKYVVKVMAQRGLLELPLEIAGFKCKDIFVVNRKSIDTLFLSYCNDYIKELYTSDLDIDYDTIEVFSVLQQLSFTSYGKDTFSSISILIDCLCVQPDYISKQAADFALITFVQSLKLTTEQQADLKNLLDTKYMVSDIKRIDIVLKRIKDNLALNYNLEESQKEAEA